MNLSEYRKYEITDAQWSRIEPWALSLWHGINDTESSNVNVHFEAVEPSNTLEITVTDDGKGLEDEPKEK